MQIWDVSTFYIEISNILNYSFDFPSLSCPVINLPDITFQYGRQDCSTSPTTTDVNLFPDASWDRETLMVYFSDHFGYTTDEVCIQYIEDELSIGKDSYG